MHLNRAVAIQNIRNLATGLVADGAGPWAELLVDAVANKAGEFLDTAADQVLAENHWVFPEGYYRLVAGRAIALAGASLPGGPGRERAVLVASPMVGDLDDEPRPWD